jgi:hypothetical protein
LTSLAEDLQGEAEHRRVKRFYRRTNKVHYERQVAKHERRLARLRRIADKHAKLQRPTMLSSKENDDKLLASNPKEHHQIAEGTKYPIKLVNFATADPSDPALKVVEHFHATLTEKKTRTLPTSFMIISYHGFVQIRKNSHQPIG